MRLDKWLWHARFFKSRSLATRFIEKSRCRIDGRVVDKPHAAVAPGMVATEMAAKLSPEFRNNAVRESVLGHLAEPSDIAHVVAFLSSDFARHVTGQVIRVDGGQYI